MDTLLRGGTLIDGSGNPAFRADVGIEDGKIVAVGQLSKRDAAQVMDCDGLMIAPGFIDSHSHDEFNLSRNPLAPGKLLQGVTTQVTGQCGWSPAPISEKHRHLFVENASFLDSGLDYQWNTMESFLQSLPPLSQNVAQLVGHVAVRCAVMGMEDRPPTDTELSDMKALVAESMQGGAFGFSTGLIYPPSAYADIDEIAVLAKIAAHYGGGYHTHIRNEGLGIFDSIKEAAEVGRRSGGAVHISHLKLNDRQCWGQATALLALLESFCQEGIQLNWDQYPYPAGCSGLKSLLPNWTHEGGPRALMERLNAGDMRDQIRAEMLEQIGKEGSDMRVGRWQDVMIADSPAHPESNGFTLVELAEKHAQLPVDVMLDLLIDDYAKTLSIFFNIGIEDMEQIMAHPQTTIGSDGIITTPAGEKDLTKPHPRYYGTFPRVLGKYARDKALFSLETAVHKMTALPAKAFHLQDRGRIAPQLVADLVVFEPTTVMDTATYRMPQQVPIGIQSVFVNGQLSAHEGKPTGATAGQILSRTA